MAIADPGRSSASGSRRPGAAPSPESTVMAWADAWRRLDAAGVTALFTADATYVSALSGELCDLGRRFRAAARTWRQCRIGDVSAWLEESAGDRALVRATYRFSGTTRRGAVVAYTGDATFQLRRMTSDEGDGPVWRIAAFHESARPEEGP